MEPHDFLESLRADVRAFAEARAWQPFHTPKNLAMALSVEAAELVEIFQWLSAEESADLAPARREAARQELADILIYLVRLADVMGVDLRQAARDKLLINTSKYPVQRAHGNATKYDAAEREP
jgi:NTP pyrophosphatase (non-canonical NTP hydrolase)